MSFTMEFGESSFAEILVELLSTEDDWDDVHCISL